MGTEHRDDVDVLRALVVVQRHWEARHHADVEIGEGPALDPACRNALPYALGGLVLRAYGSVKGFAYELRAVLHSIQLLRQRPRGPERNHPAVPFGMACTGARTAPFSLFLFHFQLIYSSSALATNLVAGQR